MIKNYFKTAWKNLTRNKIYSIINIAGLSIGLACAMLIILYVKDEVSFDRFHKNVNNIYRIVSKSTYEGQTHEDSNTGFLQGPRFTQNVPGIQSFVRISGGSVDIKKGTDISSQDVLHVDSGFFSIFTFPLLHGDPATCLKSPNSVVISAHESRKLFGTTDAVGKVIMLKEDSAFTPYQVTAVARNCPQNSSIQFDMLLPFKETEADANNNENWYSFFLNTFVVLNPHANLSQIEDRMQQFYLKDAAATFKELIKKYGSDPGAQMGTYFLQPFTDMHLNPELSAQNGLTNGSNPIYDYILSAIALFILLIACINFVNLTVARSVGRAKEIGIRKVIGGDRKQLILQFLGESFFFCLAAFVFAIGLVKFILPVFNQLANKALAISYLLDIKLIFAYIALLIITTLLAGFYPALVLSGYKPVETLYSRFNIAGKSYLQKSLVILQFSLASFMIIATFTIYAQFNFLTTQKLGYDDSNLVIVNAGQVSHQEAAVFKSELLKDPNITAVAAKNSGQWITGAKLSNDSTISFQYETVDESYISELKIPILLGRNFSKSYPSDANNSILVNASFVKKAGWKNPIGQAVIFNYDNNKVYHVIGVVKDYHYLALNQKIGPQLFTMKNDNLLGDFYIKIKPNGAPEALKTIQKTFQQFFPMTPYSYNWMDQINLKNYEAEAKWKQIMLFSAILTIFISCIGLFGLSVLSAEKRTKEIGIRKVLGASVNNIVLQLSKSFLALVIISLLIAIPLAWIASSKWLQNYPYRISLSGWLFAPACILVIMIAFITVSFQAIKAAMANPVENLRTE
jgi:putative ABC transport system permease protein